VYKTVTLARGVRDAVLDSTTPDMKANERGAESAQRVLLQAAAAILPAAD